MTSIGILGALALLVVLLIVVAVPALVVGWMVTSAMKQQARNMQTALDACFAKQQASLQQEMQSLAPNPVAAAPAAPPPAPTQRISEDKLMILGAVLACHFGKRVKIRSARVVTVGSGSNVWSQQGRAQVQASHSGLY